MTDKNNKPILNKRNNADNLQYTKLQIPLEDDYAKSYSGAVLNILQQTNLTEQTPQREVNVLKKETSVTQAMKSGGNVKVALALTDISAIEGLRELKTTTQQLLGIVLMATCAKIQNNITPEVEMSYTEYMALRNLKDRKHACSQLKKDLDALYDTSVSYTPVFNPKAQQDIEPFADARILDSRSAADGKMTFRVGQTFYEKVLRKCSVIPTPISLFRINSKQAPSAYYIGLKFTHTKYMNAGTKTADKLSTATLMETVPNLPSVEAVKQKDRNLTKHIIDPIERGLNELVNCGTFSEWFYVDVQGNRYESSVMNFNVFKTLNVQVVWKDYPVNSQPYLKKAARNTTPQNRKRKPRKKKTETEN